MAKHGNIFVSIIKVIAGLALIAVLATAIYGIVYFTNGLTTSFKSFYLVYNDKIIKDNIEVNVPNNKECTFEVKYIFDKVIDSTEYSVEIVPNQKNDFDFTFNGATYSWCGKEIDHSKMYKLKVDKSSFKITIDYDIIKHLKLQIGDINLAEGVELDTTRNSYFQLVVKSYNEKVVYYIDLKDNILVESIEIGNGVIFG